MAKPDETTKRWLDPASLTPRMGSIYPAPFAAPVDGREKRALGDPLGLTQCMKTKTSSSTCSKAR
jgi:hypothetical protein